MDSPDQKAPTERRVDPVVEAYKRDVDRTLLRQALRMSPAERLMELQRLCEAAEEFRRAGQEAKAGDDRFRPLIFSRTNHAGTTAAKAGDVVGTVGRSPRGRRSMPWKAACDASPGTCRGSSRFGLMH